MRSGYSRLDGTDGLAVNHVPDPYSNAIKKIALEPMFVAEWTGLEPATPGVTGPRQI